MPLLPERREGYPEIMEFQGSLNDLNAILKTGEWSVLRVLDGYRPRYILIAYRSSVIVSPGEDILRFKVTSSEDEANEMLFSGKWRKAAVGVVQNSSVVDGQVRHSGGVLFVFERIQF